QNSQLSSKAKKDTFSLENSFYSRYGTTNSNRTIQNPSAQPKNHNEPKKFSVKPPYPNSVTSSSPFQNSDDEFDFDFPSSHSTKWTGSKPQATRSNPFTYSDSTLGGDGAQNNAQRNYPGSSFNF
uniref:Uncharacterized protein n=1 Tax=Ciona savignyi TaxID=51511 RepID=H2ZLM7_CIOSA